MSGIARPHCGECSKTCSRHREHPLKRIYNREGIFKPIGWHCECCERLWNDKGTGLPQEAQEK
jgi:hypothetical protein